MKRMVLPLLLSVFCFYACSNNQNGTPRQAASIDPNTDPSAFAQAFIDSLRPLTVDLSQIRDIKTLLCQQWEHLEDKKDNDEAAKGGSLNYVTVYRGMAFYNDGSMVRNPRSYISLGKWQYDDATKTITMNLSDGENYKYKIKAVSADELQLIDLEDASPTVITYVSQAFGYKKNEDDPFYTANNQWRIKPKKPETQEQINKRVRDCVRFYGLFYNDNLLRDTSIISFIGLPSCFNWYSGGIGVQKAEKLGYDWQACFYDKAQALKAHALLENLILQKYYWTRGKFDWRVKTAKVLQQMIEKSEALLQ